MQSIPHTENTASKAAYEAIEKELSREIELGLGERCKKSFEATLEIFMNAGLSRLKHQNWRETELPTSAQRLHIERYMTLNPEARVKEQWEKAISAKDTIMLCILGQEIDDEGKSQHEHAAKWTPRYPVHLREDLDVWAAEEYVKQLNMSKEPRHESNQTSINQRKAPHPNSNPSIKFETLRKALEKERHSRAALEQAVKRCIAKNKGKECPWRMQGCASQYQIINAPIRDGRDKPTPGSCFYQKIDQETA